MKNRCGFTLIELLVVISIILSVAGFVMLRGTQPTKQLDKEAQQLVDVLESSRKRAVAGENSIACAEVNQFDGYVVTTSPTGYTLQISCNGTAVNPPLSIYTFPTQVRSSTATIQFNALTGQLNAPRSIVVQRQNNCIDISITASGVVSYCSRTCTQSSC